VGRTQRLERLTSGGRRVRPGVPIRVRASFSLCLSFSCHLVAQPMGFSSSEWPSIIIAFTKDKDAVRAGLTWWINNGMVEGHVTKLKLIKRQGYVWSGGLSTARENASFMRSRKNKPSKSGCLCSKDDQRCCASLKKSLGMVWEAVAAEVAWLFSCSIRLTYRSAICLRLHSLATSC
jgi:hypothetical protein